MFYRFLALSIILLLARPVYAQTCTPNNNSDFSISGNVLSSSTPLSAGGFTAGITVIMPGVSNSGIGCYPVTVLGGSGSTISVNNSFSGAMVSPGSNLTLAASNGPGNNGDWIAVCNNLGTASYPYCDGAGYFWAWLDNCTMTGTLPTASKTSNTCMFPAPTANGSYVANFMDNAGYTILASTPFTVAGGSAPAITAVFVTPSTLLNGSSLSGQLITQCNGNNPCPGTPIYSLSSSSPCNGQTNNNNLFTLSGGILSSAAMNTNGTYYACVTVAMNGVSNTNATMSVAVNITSGGALAGSMLPPCPRGCTWVVAYNSDFTTETSFDYTHSPVDASHEWFVPNDGIGAPGSPGATNECSQMIDASTMPGYLSIHTTGTIGWEVPGALVCSGMQIKGGAAGMIPGLVDSCFPTEPELECVSIAAPIYYEYKMVASPHMINEELLYAGLFGGNTSFAAFLMEARGDNTSITGDGLPLLWPNGNHGRIQGPYKGWINGDPNPHIVGFVRDPSAGYSAYWDGTLAYPDSTQCTLAPCTPDPDNCANGPTTCYSNNPTAPVPTFDFGVTSCTSCGAFVPGTAKFYFFRAYVGVNGTGGPPPPTPAVTVNGTSSGTMVAASSNLTVAVTNPPASSTAWVGICDTATNPAGADCDLAGFNWDYLNCQRTAPSAPTNLTPCTLVAPAPANTTSYYVNLFSSNSYTVVASAPFTVTGTGQTGGTCTPAGSPCPVGVAAPAGTHWAFQWSDEFTQDSSLNLNNWNPNGVTPSCCSPTNGIIFQPQLGDYNVIGGNVRSAINSQTPGSFKPKLTHGTPPVGSVFIEYYTLYPHNNSGEGYGYHPDIWYHPFASDGISFTGYEDDICENGLGQWPNVPTTVCQNGIGQSPNITQYECNCAVGDVPYDPNWHYYGFYWANDGSASGSQTIYYDGTAYSGPYTFQAPDWNNGLIIIMSEDSCDTVHYTCNFNVISPNNPMSVRYVRVWYLVAG